MAEWPRSGPYLRALAEWGFDSRLATGFAILGRNLFASPGARGSFFILLRCCNHFSSFILTELGVGLIVGNVVPFLWRGAWGGFGGLAWHPPIALTGWGLVECEIPTPSFHDMMYPLANGAKNLGLEVL
jgi:hypothetical protein